MPATFSPRVTQRNYLGFDLVFFPYEELGCLVFDDPEVGLVKEEFVDGADTLIRKMVALDARGAEEYFVGVSAVPKPATRELRYLGERDGGVVYRCDELDQDAWFCPSFFHYLPSPPAYLWVRAFAAA